MPRLDNTQNPLKITAPTGGIAAGGLKLISGILFYCPEAIAAAATGAGYWTDRIIRAAPKATGAAWVVGQKLYWSTANSNFTTTATGNTLRGFAVSAAASGDATGDVQLCQIPA